MIIYLSGEENLARPEVVFGRKSTVMLTYFEVRLKSGKPSKRFRKIFKSCKRKPQ